MNLKKNGNVMTRISVGNGPSSYDKRIYRAAVSQRLRNSGLNYYRTKKKQLRDETLLQVQSGTPSLSLTQRYQ